MSVVTLNSVLKSVGIRQEESVYADFTEKQMTFPMALHGEFDIYHEEDERRNYAGWRKFYEMLSQKKLSPEYQSVQSEIHDIDEKNRALNISMREVLRNGIQPDEETQNLAKNLRVRKKELKALIDELEQKIHDECVKECTQEGIILGKEFLRYKKELFLNHYQNVHAIFPEMPENPDMPLFRDIPLFTNNLLNLKSAMNRGEEIAVEGGPCLFGLQEVYIIVTMDDGTERKFDYNTAHYGPDDTGISGCESLEELFTSEAQKIHDVSFINNKKGLTRQEHYELLYPFKIAEFLGAKLVIPIPDLSYIKYVTALAGKLKPQVRDNMISRFKEVCFSIADVMLKKIDEIKAEFPEVQCKVVHARDTEICREYEEQRAIRLMGSKSRDIVRHLTKNEYRQLSILDYCTMPALPLYLYGIRNILQVDCVDEVDSYRKCRQLHKTGINLAAMLYPEYVSRDGQHTVFYSKLEYKEYIQ